MSRCGGGGEAHTNWLSRRAERTGHIKSQKRIQRWYYVETERCTYVFIKFESVGGQADTNQHTSKRAVNNHASRRLTLFPERFLRNSQSEMSMSNIVLGTLHTHI